MNVHKEKKERLHFLIVDDKDLVLTLMSRILKTNGYKNITRARNGIEALNRLKKKNVNFIITDWEMPKMTGIELLELLRKDEKYFDLPVVMLCEYMEDAKFLYAMEEGVDAFQKKPFSEKDIMNCINKVLDAKMNPDPLKYKLQKLTAMKIREEYDRALTFAQELMQEEKHAEIFCIMSECYSAKHEYEEAERCLNESLDVQTNSKALFLLGKLYESQGKVNDALEAYREAHGINPLNADIVIAMGQAFLQTGKTKEAADMFASLQENNMTEMNATNIGAAYLISGDITKAGRYLDQAKTPIEETIGIFNRYAIELRKNGRLEEALDQYDRCLKIDPHNHILLFNAALSNAELKRFGKAEQLLTKCLKIDQNYSTARQLMDFVKEKMKKQKQSHLK